MQDSSNSFITASNHASTSGASTSAPAHPPTPTPATSNLIDLNRVGTNNNATTRSTPPLREDRSSDSTSRFKQNTIIDPRASAVSSASQGSTNTPMTSRTVDVGRAGPNNNQKGKTTNTQTRRRTWTLQLSLLKCVYLHHLTFRIYKPFPIHLKYVK